MPTVAEGTAGAVGDEFLRCLVRHPDDVELAAYFIVSESLTNASRYAEADTVRVRVAPLGDALEVEIEDNGRGGADAAPEPASAGSPTGSMRSAGGWTSTARPVPEPAHGAPPPLRPDV